MTDPSEKLADEAWLREQYVDERRSLRDVAAEVGVPPNTLRGALIAHGVDTRPGGRTRRTSDEELLSSIREAAADVDGSLTMSEYSGTVEHHPQTAVNRFGSWTSAKRSAGVE